MFYKYKKKNSEILHGYKRSLTPQTLLHVLAVCDIQQSNNRVAGILFKIEKEKKKKKQKIKDITKMTVE